MLIHFRFAIDDPRAFTFRDWTNSIFLSAFESHKNYLCLNLVGNQIKVPRQNKSQSNVSVKNDLILFGVLEIGKSISELTNGVKSFLVWIMHFTIAAAECDAVNGPLSIFDKSPEQINSKRSDFSHVNEATTRTSHWKTIWIISRLFNSAIVFGQKQFRSRPHLRGPQIKIHFQCLVVVVWSRRRLIFNGNSRALRVIRMPQKS